MTDDVAGTRGVVRDVLEDLAKLRHVGVTRGEEPLRRLRVGEHGGQRLVQFMRHGSGELAHDGNARNVRDFLAMALHLGIRLLALGDVQQHAQHLARRAIQVAAAPASSAAGASE